MKAISDVKMKKIIQRIKKLFVFGKWPDLSTGALFAVGNGTADDDRSNAFEVHDDGCVITNNTDYMNPPMAMGVEYRTAERYNGKAVYAKLVSIGVLPNNSSKTIENVISGGIHDLVGLTYSVYSDDTIDYITNDEDISIRLVPGGIGLGLYISTTYDFSDFSGYVTLKYTKD